MDIALIITGGRSGADLLQSLFDSHPEILQFPGVLQFDDDFIKIFNLKSDKEISKYFIKINKQFFDSRINKKERHHKLGTKKNDFFIVDKKKFIKKFIKHYNRSKKTNYDLLESLHKAYCKNIKKKKLIIVHVHLQMFLANYIKYIGLNKNLKILLTFRDPLVSMCSAINNWLNYKKGIDLTPRNLFTNIDIHFNNFNNLHFIRKKIRVVKLENLHKFSILTLKKICKYLKINFSRSMLKSTYHRKKWWGDALSKKYLNGLNKKFKNNFDFKLFDNKEILYLESKLYFILKKYNYPFRSKITQSYEKYYFLPFNFEKKTWNNVIKKNKFKIKTKLSIIYFYLKRIFLLRKKNLFNLYTLPKEI